jgi:hypothetical protein
MKLVNLLPLFALCFLCSCTAVKVKSVDPTDTLREFRQDILSSDTLSPFSLQALRMAGITQQQALEDGIDEADRVQFEKFATPLDKSYIESELAIGRAQILERSQPEKAMGLYLHAADLASQGFFLKECKAPVDLRCDSFKVFYDRAVRGVVSYLTEKNWKTEPPLQFPSGAGRTFTLGVNRQGPVEDPSEYASIVPASSIGLEGLTNRHRQNGIGVSLVACRPRRDGSREEMYLPRVGVCLPLTAVIRFPKQSCRDARCEARLDLVNSVTGEDQYKLNGVALPLAADYTAPLAALVEKTGMSGWDGLFDAIQGNEELLKNTGFYTMEPYNAGKIPLITVHGLFSNPLTWIDVHNDLMGDPIIREKYQVWHYLYPTSLPIVENAKTFRDKLDQLHDYLIATSPKGTTPPTMVIVSHSMGGLLSRTVVVRDSKGLQEVYFEDPSRVKELDKEVQDQIDAYLNFSRKPYVSRVIFVAVPHRGSDIADNWLGRIGRALLSLPKTVVQKSVAIARGARNIIRPDLRTEFDGGEPSSIRGLSAKNPTLIGLSKLEIDSGVQYHSIIGDRGLGDSPNSSDGVVAYSSSHVDGAASELIVPADHTAHAHPKAVSEIRRVLREHTDQILRATNTPDSSKKP